jgi:hypothetical protein
MYTRSVVCVLGRFEHICSNSNKTFARHQIWYKSARQLAFGMIRLRSPERKKLLNKAPNFYLIALVPVVTFI